jgi:endo-1,4-beta-xylanase
MLITRIIRTRMDAKAPASCERRWLFAAAIVTAMVMFCANPTDAQIAKGTGKFLGGATSAPVWSKFTSYWNQVTPGNAGKWGSVEGVRGTMNTSDFDAIYNYAISNGIPFKEHTLVWGAQEPGWIAGLDTASQRAEIEEWFRFVGQRYSSMSYVDVVNEPFHQPPSYKNALGGDGATGWDWVITAFQLARQHMIKGTKLILNEYNVLGNTTSANNFVNLITLLKDRGLIDAIGIQGHYFEFRSHIGATSGVYLYDTLTIKANLDKIAAVGLPLYIAEFDIDEPDDANQLAQYKIYFSMLWTHPGVKGITLWGYKQDDVWSSYPNTFLLYADGRERPVLPWLRKFVTIPAPPVLVAPVGTSSEPRNPRMIWRKSQSAKSYRLQVSTTGGMSSFVVDTTTIDTVYQAPAFAAGSRIYWHVSASNDSGTSAYTATAVFVTGDQILTVEGAPLVPAKLDLLQNYPNPFNPTTGIRYQVPAISEVKLVVYDMLGRELATVVKETKMPGTYEAGFDATGLPSGVYVYRLTAGQTSISRKMVFMK